MTNALTPWRYETHDVRTIMIDGEPWFVARDLCDALDLSNTSMALKGLEAEDIRKVYTPSVSGEQETLIVNEPGMYTLILRSNKPEAKAFRLWITREVLPSIRTSGTYSTNSAEHLLTPEQALLDRLDAIEARLKRDDACILRLMEEIGTLHKPNVQAFPLSFRGQLVELVGRGARRMPRSKTAFRDAWNRVYTRLRITEKIDIKKLAAEKGMDNLDYAEQTLVRNVDINSTHEGSLIHLMCTIAADLFTPMRQITLSDIEGFGTN